MKNLSQERNASIMVLQEIFNFNTPQILSCIRLMKRFHTKNYQFTLSVSYKYTFLWKHILEELKPETITSKTSMFYAPHQYATIENTIFRFVPDVNILYKSYDFLNVKSSKNGSKINVSLSYIEEEQLSKKNLQKLLKTNYDIYTHTAEEILFGNWVISKASYYPTQENVKTETELRLDRNIVECQYIGIPENIEMELFDLLALLYPTSNYYGTLLSLYKFDIPQTKILSNSILNMISPSDCKLVLTTNVEPIQLYILRNVWKNGDIYVVNKNGNIVYSHFDKSSIQYSFTKNIKYDVQTKAILCVGKSIIYGDDDCNYFEKATVTTIVEPDWNSVFEKYPSGIIVTIVSGSLLYLSYSNHIPIYIDVLDTRNEYTFHHTLFDFYLRNTKPIEAKCTCIVRNGDCWTQTESSSSDTPTDLFYKFALQYQPKYIKQVTRNNLDQIFKILYQYTNEKILYHTKGETGIVFFDSYTIDAREFISLTSFQRLILVNDKSNIVQYLECIQTRSMETITLLNPGLIIRSTIPKIEVVDNFNVDKMIPTLIKNTSFIINSIDTIYIQNEFKYFDTISKLIILKNTIPLIKSRRGHLYISFINIDDIPLQPKISSIIENLMFITNPTNVSLNHKTSKLKKPESLLLRLTDKEYTSDCIQMILKQRELISTVASAIVVKTNSDRLVFDETFWSVCQYNDKIAFLHLPNDALPPIIKAFVINQFVNGKLVWSNNKELCITTISAALLNMIFGYDTDGNFEPELSQTPYTTMFINQYIGKNIVFDVNAVKAEMYFAAYTLNVY